MPTYEYRCAKCGEDLEVFQTFAETPLTKHAGCGGKLAKVLSPAGIVLKGSGFYKNDSRDSSSKKRASSSSSSEKSEKSEKSESSNSSSGDSAKSDGAKSETAKSEKPKSEKRDSGSTSDSGTKATKSDSKT